ncbi:MAG TPA: DUF3501 family protein [Nitrospiria bacterium]|nr:DUF3501 family protein [Nitrospiria bacterium]
MEKLAFSDIKPLAEYEQERAGFRRRIIELKAHRRIALGPSITLVFENRDTVRFQIQEMLRVEHIEERRKVLDELEAYNGLIPEEGTLSATLFIEITEAGRIKEWLDRLMGIDRPGRLWLELGGERCPAEFEAGHSNETQLSAVHYLRFRLTPVHQRRLADPSLAARLGIDHPHYQASAELGLQTRQSLLTDL